MKSRTRLKPAHNTHLPCNQTQLNPGDGRQAARSISPPVRVKLTQHCQHLWGVDPDSPRVCAMSAVFLSWMAYHEVAISEGRVKGTYLDDDLHASVASVIEERQFPDLT